MKKGQIYSWTSIMMYAESYNFGYQDYGVNVIGQSFMVFEHETKDLTMSFVLVGVGGVGSADYTYECIYSDIK